jgi:hypothetical protein
VRATFTLLSARIEVGLAVSMQGNPIGMTVLLTIVSLSLYGISGDIWDLIDSPKDEVRITDLLFLNCLAGRNRISTASKD